MAAVEEAVCVTGRGPAQLMLAAALGIADELRLEEGGLHAEVPAVDGEVLERLTRGAGEANLASELLAALPPRRLLGRLAGVGAAARQEEAQAGVDDRDGTLRTGDDGVGRAARDGADTLFGRAKDVHHDPVVVRPGVLPKCLSAGCFIDPAEEVDVGLLAVDDVAAHEDLGAA